MNHNENNDEIALAQSLLAQVDGENPSQARLAPVTSGLSGATVFRVDENGRAPHYA
jgi:hypothetical protein